MVHSDYSLSSFFLITEEAQYNTVVGGHIYPRVIGVTTVYRKVTCTVTNDGVGGRGKRLQHNALLYINYVTKCRNKK